MMPVSVYARPTAAAEKPLAFAVSFQVEVEDLWQDDSRHASLDEARQRMDTLAVTPHVWGVRLEKRVWFGLWSTVEEYQKDDGGLWPYPVQPSR